MDDADETLGRSTRGGLLIWLVLLGAVAVSAMLGWTMLRGAGADSIHAEATLPDRFTTCGRQWHRSVGDIQTRESVAAIGAELVVVDTAPLADCPPAVHPTPIGMATVVYVRVGEDRFATYELVGGP